MTLKPLRIVSILSLGVGTACAALLFADPFSMTRAVFAPNHIAATDTPVATQNDIADMARQLANAAPHDRVVEQSLKARRGDTLIDMLRRADVPSAQAENAVRALKTHYNPRALKTGQDLAVVFERDAQKPNHKHFVGFHFKPSPDKKFQVARLNNGDFSAKSFSAPVQEEIVRAEGVIRGSLSAAAAAASIPNSITQEAITAFAHEVDFQRDLKAGDRFVAVFSRKVTSDGHIISNGQLKYAALTLDGEKKEIFRFVHKDGSTAFYDAEGKSIKRALMRTPINSARITSGFGMRRHPILGYSKMHRGVDFGAPTGTPIYASGDGVIEKIGRFSDYGNYIRIKHNTNIATAYGHMSRFAPGLRAGARVKQGTVIGYVGSTGRSTGPHLHYEVLKGSAQVNPLTVVSMAGDSLQGKDLKRFKQDVASLRLDARRLSVARAADNVSDKTATPPKPGKSPVAQASRKRQVAEAD